MYQELVVLLDQHILFKQNAFFKNFTYNIDSRKDLQQVLSKEDVQKDVTTQTHIKLSIVTVIKIILVENLEFIPPKFSLNIPDEVHQFTFPLPPAA